MRVIKEWEIATENVAKAFLKKYFPQEIYKKDTFWVSDIIGETLHVSDRFFNLDRMVEILKFKATYEQLDDYYETELEWFCESQNQNKPFHTNFKNFVKYGWVGKKEEK